MAVVNAKTLQEKKLSRVNNITSTCSLNNTTNHLKKLCFNQAIEFIDTCMRIKNNLENIYFLNLFLNLHKLNHLQYMDHVAAVHEFGLTF